MGEPDIESTRLAAPVITRERLADIWPEVVRRLRRMLYLRGLDPHQADDLVQEVAVRALAVQLTFESVEDFYAWAAPVARNLHVDLVRARARTTDGTAVLPAIAAPTNIEHEVERRLTLERVLDALATMGPADRSAILDRVNDAAPEAGEAGKIAVRRHRARQRLRLLVNGALSWAGVVALARRARAVAAPSLTSAALAAPVLLAAGLPLSVFDHRTPPVTPRTVVVPATRPVDSAAAAPGEAVRRTAVTVRVPTGAPSAARPDVDEPAPKPKPITVPGMEDGPSIQGDNEDPNDGHVVCFDDLLDRTQRHCLLRIQEQSAGDAATDPAGAAGTGGPAAVPVVR